MLASALGGLLTFSIGLCARRPVEALFARSAALGFIGLGLAGLALLAALVLAGRETRAIFRQRRIALLHIALARAHEADDRDEARATGRRIGGALPARPETANARKHLDDMRREIIDGRDLIDIAERQLMTSLDALARSEVAAAAKRVSLVAPSARAPSSTWCLSRRRRCG